MGAKDRSVDAAQPASSEDVVPPGSSVAEVSSAAVKPSVAVVQLYAAA